MAKLIDLLVPSQAKYICSSSLLMTLELDPRIRRWNLVYSKEFVQNASNWNACYFDMIIIKILLVHCRQVVLGREILFVRIK